MVFMDTWLYNTIYLPILERRKFYGLSEMLKYFIDGFPEPTEKIKDTLSGYKSNLRLSWYVGWKTSNEFTIVAV